MRKIAQALGRSVSTVSDEIKNGKVRKKYDPEKAHHKACVRRWRSKYQGMNVVADTPLRNRVDILLLKGESPANIAGRLRKHEKKNISKNSIYRYIASIYGRKVEAVRLKKKKRRTYKRPASKKLSDRTFIDKRPLYINTRKRIGDVEADFIVSGKSGKGILLTVVDRKSRMPYLEKILPVNIRNMERSFQRIKQRFPEMKTITTDNDILFQKHTELEKILHTKIYFCHPYHSWEKGTVENVNRYIRRDIPKGSNISKFSKKFIQSIEERLQNKIYQVLRYQTPKEVLTKHRQRKNTRE